MSELSQDEVTCLMILEKGEALLAIGKWGPALERMYQRGLVGRRQTPGGGVDYVIGRGGEKALEDYKHDEAVELIEANNALVKARGLNNSMKDSVREMAMRVADIAIASSKMAGDDPAVAARKWTETMLAEAIRIIGKSDGH